PALLRAWRRHDGAQGLTAAPGGPGDGVPSILAGGWVGSEHSPNQSAAANLAAALALFTTSARFASTLRPPVRALIAPSTKGVQAGAPPAGGRGGRDRLRAPRLDVARRERRLGGDRHRHDQPGPAERPVQPRDRGGRLGALDPRWHGQAAVWRVEGREAVRPD